MLKMFTLMMMTMMALHIFDCRRHACKEAAASLGL